VKFLISLLLIFSSLSSLHNTIVYAGCFPRKDIKSSFTVIPKRKCFEVSVGPGCVGSVELSITNKCDEVYIYEKEGNLYELYNHPEWLKVYKSNKSAVHYFYDRDVPQEYVNWKRSVYEKGNSSNKIDIVVTNVKVKPLEIPQYSGVLVGIIATLFGLLVLSVFKRKNSEHRS